MNTDRERKSKAKHSAAKPQPMLASAAEADFKKHRYGRAEARPSEGNRNFARGATNFMPSSTENTEGTEDTEKAGAKRATAKRGILPHAVLF
jgi:hypothetical protein